MSSGSLRYWGGPYDGELVHPAHRIVGRPGFSCPPIKDRVDAAGNLVVNPLGSYEQYERVYTLTPLDRFEWRGTFIPKITA